MEQDKKTKAAKETAAEAKPKTTKKATAEEKAVKKTTAAKKTTKSVAKTTTEAPKKPVAPKAAAKKAPTKKAAAVKKTEVSETTKAEQAKAEQAKAEQAKAEQAKAEQAKAEQAKAEQEKKIKALFVASECYPFIVTGGLGDVAGALPKSLVSSEIAMSVVVPLYSDIPEKYRAGMEFLQSFEVSVAWRSQYCGVFKLVRDNVTYYFLDNEFYFKRKGIYGFYDDAERFAFFSRAVLEMICRVPECEFDIIHANDWQSALINTYVNLYYRNVPKLAGVKTLFTIHNIQYQGKYGTELLTEILGIGPNDSHLIELGGCVNFMKGAITCSDKVNTVSPTYANEILDPWFSHGLDGVLLQHRHKLCGILNGIDYEVYNPQNDRLIAKTFSSNDVSGKYACKQALVNKFGFEDKDAPVLGIVSRLVAHKGFDLVKHVLEYILLSGINVVILGSGDKAYENCFNDFASRYPGKIGVYIGFDPHLAREIYAGSDLFLMPSKSEPCGLAQMISVRYGTIPIVRETGGLSDSITDCSLGDGNGFTFKSYNAHDMLDACLRAKAVFDDKQNFNKLVQHAMSCDFSWDSAAEKYKWLYKEMVELW